MIEMDDTQAETPTLEEFGESLIGFDEIAIKKTFGVALETLGEDNKVQFIRALIFVHRRRNGDNDITAYNTAQNMRIGDVKSYFAEESVESGKDD